MTSVPFLLFLFLLHIPISQVSAYKFYISYKIYDEGMKTVKHTATTAHCFLNNDFKPVSLKKEAPELYDKLLLMANPEAY